MRAVIYAHAASLGCPFFQEIDSYAVTAPDYKICVHTEISEAVHCGLPDGMCGQFGHISAVQPKIGQRYSHVGFSSAESGL